MSAADRCTCADGSPVISKGDPISAGGQCCGGKGPAVFHTEEGGRCTLCIVFFVTENESLLAEALEWDPEADDYIERGRRISAEARS